MRYKNTNILIFSIFLILAVYLSYIGGYGSDEDTLPMIGTFLGYKNGIFMTSRFTGYPVAEFIIGFSSYFFGSFYTNLIIFFSFLIGSIIFFLSIENKLKIESLLFFLIFLMSNPVLYFDNLEPIDYSLAFLFFSLGYYFLVKKKIELSIIFFGICLGARINFAPFIIILILLDNQVYAQNYFRKFSIIICSLFIGCLFYLPVWINSELTLDWLRAGRPEGNFLEYFVRFLYKLVITIGYIQLILLGILIKIYFKDLLKFKKFNLLIFLILTNLAIFLYIPAELSYLQPMIIFLYYFLFKALKPKFIYFIIGINVFTWFINFDLIKINYKNTGKCDPIVAISANFEFEFRSSSK